ncbi:MAG: YMGG-like glycine zipper-containing protein [Candidatus Hodarchaeota archaeon]
MKKRNLAILVLILPIFLVSCAHVTPDRYNTQRGAAIGAGAGALIGQAIGRNAEGTLIGLAAGTILGALVGNAVDQDYQAVRDAAYHDKPVIYYDKKGCAVEAIPEGIDRKTNCHRVTKRTWQDGELVSETVEEICEDPAYSFVRPYPVYRYYPRVYLYYNDHPRPYCHPWYYPWHPRHPHRW